MRNIKLIVEYDGTGYCGWQIQNPKIKSQNPKIKTVQGEIEGALKKLLGEKVNLVGSGRTDAGVHALAQVANFKTSSTLSLERIRKGLNGTLPGDISIKDASLAPDDFNARFDAKYKAYRYAIRNSSDAPAIGRFYCVHVRHPLNISLMRREGSSLLGRHDFSSFRLSGSSISDPVRTIKKLSVMKRASEVFIYIEADGFLYGMARSIAGTLIDIGRGKTGRGSIKRIMGSRRRAAAGPTAPANGLTLMRVAY